MDIIIQQKLDSYLALLDEIKERTKDDETARALLGEVAQDLRSEKIREQTVINGIASATESQIGYLKRLGAEIPEGLTKQQASVLINNAKAARKWGQKPVEVIGPLLEEEALRVHEGFWR